MNRVSYPIKTKKMVRYILELINKIVSFQLGRELEHKYVK